MSATRIWIGVLLLGMAVTAFSLGLARVTSQLAVGQANIDLSAALALAGVLVLWRSRPPFRDRGGEPG